MADSQSPPSRYPPSMGPGARPTNERRSQVVESAQAIRERRTQYKWEKQDDGLKLEYVSPIDGSNRAFVIPYTSISWPSLRLSTSLYTSIAAYSILDNLAETEALSGLPQTQQSAEAYSYYVTQGLVWKQVGKFFLAGVGFKQWYQTRDTMKFPLRKVKPAERYNEFPNRFVPIIKGTWARGLWQTTRLGMVILPWVTFVQWITFNVIGNTRAQAGSYSDDRIRPYRDAIIAKRKEAISKNQQINRQIEGGLQQNRQQAAPAPSEFASALEDTTSDLQTYSDRMQDGYSDPGTGSYNDPSMDNTADSDFSSSGTKSRTQQQPSQSQPYGQRQQQQRTQPRRSPPQQQQPSSSSSDDPFAFNEDPLLSAASDPDSPQYNPSAATQQAKAPRRSWADIRRGAQQTSGSSSVEAGGFASAESFGEQAASPRARRPAQQQQGSESYGGQGDAERQKEREQREFDAMLERERRLGQGGGDGGGGRGGGGGWGGR